MILKGRTRAGGGQLATYLLSDKNAQVRVLDIRGTVVDERNAAGLKESLHDMDELGKMTRAQSSLFHLAINPDDRDHLTPQDWQYSVAKAEQALGLQGQPRAVVSHLYEGKEHLHVVWSRVNVETRKCVEMSFSNLKLCAAAREIELELGLQQTPQRARGAHKLNQQIKDMQGQQDARAAQPRQERNAAIQRAWHQSENGAQFKQQMEAAGYRLAVGKRGVLVMDASNEPHSISRAVEGIKAKDVREKLADVGALPSVEELRQPDSKSAMPQRQRAKHMTKEALSQEQFAANDNALEMLREQARYLRKSEAQRLLEEKEARKRLGLPSHAP